MSLKDVIDRIRFDERGLVPAIAQDATTGDVLMLAYMNRESFEKTLETGKAHYYSRSRKALWLKGETSGNIQTIKEILYDCDADTLLLKVEQKGVACHTGSRSCFFTPVKEAGGEDNGGFATPYVLNEIYEVIKERKATMPEGSYVASLMKKGLNKILDKVNEEAAEVIDASLNKGREDIVYEMADLWFHTLVLLGYSDISPVEVYKELRRRFGLSGIEEKRSRKKG